MRRVLINSFAILALSAVRAEALTVRDVLELARAGLGDDILLALIEVDRSVYPIDAATLKTLKAAGVAERVILAMIRSQRTPAPVVEVMPHVDVDVIEAPESQPPQVILINHERVREVLVPVPVYVPVVRRQRFPSDIDVHDPWVDTRAGRYYPPYRPHKAVEPVYWGWDGKLRPDAWKPK